MSNWTAGREKQLREDWAAGVRCGLIAARLGVTRSQVSGKARRLKLPKRRIKGPRSKAYDNSRRAAVAQAKAPPVPLKPVKPLPPGVTPPTIWKTLIDLAHDECRWPFGDRHFVFCAMPASPNLPYCACHARIAYQPGFGHLTRAA